MYFPFMVSDFLFPLKENTVEVIYREDIYVSATLKKEYSCF